MGVIKQGILGGFSGKVGTVIGAAWKGISYMRGRAISIKNPRTPAQMEQRAKWKLVLEFLKPINGFIKVGYKNQAKKQSAMNAATRQILANNVQGTYPNFTLNYPEIKIARGSLAGVEGIVIAPTVGRVTVSWTDNSGTGSALATDKAMMALVNVTKNEAVYRVEGNTRSQTSTYLPIPEGWEGNTVEVYLAFASADGKLVSDSQYVGQHTPSNS